MNQSFESPVTVYICMSLFERTVSLCHVGFEARSTSYKRVTIWQRISPLLDISYKRSFRISPKVSIKNRHFVNVNVIRFKPYGGIFLTYPN